MAKSSTNNLELAGRRLGRVLTKMGKITRDQAQEALELQKTKRAPVGQLLVELGYCNHDDVNMALAAQAGMMTMDLTDLDIKEDVLRMVPAEMANAYHVLPISHDASSNQLTVALKSADNFRALDDLRLLMGFTVEAVVAPGDQIDSMIDRHYGEDEESLASLVADLSDSSLSSESSER
ncbi:MAG: hypothetical protein AAGL98_12210, partial [Planctomycetota bacterium]